MASPAEPEVLSFGGVIRKYRIKNKLNQAALADLLHVNRSSVINWENDKAKPNTDFIITLCQTLGIPIPELFESTGLANYPTLSGPENALINSYRKLSEISQRAVNRIVNGLLEEEQIAKDKYLKENFLVLPYEPTAAAAGTGCEFVYAPRKAVFIRRNDKSKKADALIRVSGQSMEPKYHDGDLVYVKYIDDAEDGTDVICTSVDGAVIKRKEGDRIVSLNPALPYGMKSEDDHVKIVGQVLGIVDADDYAAKEDIPELQEIFADRVGEIV